MSQLGPCQRKNTWPLRIVDPRLQDGAYESQWEELTHNQAQVQLIVLYSWNLYGEQAHIEPSDGKPAPVGFEYVAKTRTYYGRFLEARRAASQPAGCPDRLPVEPVCGRARSIQSAAETLRRWSLVKTPMAEANWPG